MRNAATALTRPGKRRGHGLVRGAVLAAAGAGPAWAQSGGYSTLPPTLTDTRVSDLRGQLEQYLPGIQPRTGGPAFLVTPSLGVDAGVTDNALRAERPRRADIFTVISPAVLVSGDTARLKVNLHYAPTATIYAQTGSQTRLDQFGDGRVLATLVPNAVFLDLRGSVTQQSRTGGYGQTDTQGLNRNDQVQSAAFSVTPYAEHRFAGWGTGRVGYSFARTIQSNRGGESDIYGNPVLLNSSAFGAVGNLTSQRERASFATGENLGRVNDILAVEAVQYSGFGAYRGAHRNQVTNDIGFAVTRTITALAGFGYQDLRYSGIPGIRVNEPIWSVGGRITPNADSTLTVTYGRRDGFNAAAVDGSYSPTARTRVFVRYSTGLTSNAEEQQSLLATTNVGPTGLVVDNVTGAPVSASGNAFGTQNSLYRLRRFSVTGLLLLDRDSVSLSFAREDRTNVNAIPSSLGGVVVPPGVSTTGTIGTISWQHDLSPALSSSASFSYGMDDLGQVTGAGSGSQRTIQASLGLSYVFTRTLTGSAQYLFTDRSGGAGRAVPAAFSQPGFGAANQNLTENLLLVGLRKSF